MLCPTCKTPLTMSERQGIEIDYCAACRGVWLDRGELDKIIERSTSQAQGQPQPMQQAMAHGYPPPHGGYGYRKHKRRKSFLEELFD